MVRLPDYFGVSLIVLSTTFAATSRAASNGTSTSSVATSDLIASAASSIPTLSVSIALATASTEPKILDAVQPYIQELTLKANDYKKTFWNTLQDELSKLLTPELYYSYGRSPPVYPSPRGTGDKEWSQAYQQALSLVARMTNEQKNNVTIPSTSSHNCSGFTGSVPQHGFPGMCLQDAESGIRIANELVSGYPAQIAVGASWNKTLAYDRALYIGAEFKAKGANVVLGPVVGPLGRVAKGGRNWEGFSNDPYLAGSLVEPTVRGYQQSVIACVKHFIANEQETNRNPFLAGLLAPLGINLNNSVSANLDDRTMHELYLWPFYDAIKAGAGSVMASYNRVNNSYASQNSKLLNGLLKTELGFQGFVVSDWYAQHTGVASANSGLDMVMPSGTYWGDNQLSTAVNNGSMSQARLDDMATRILAAWYRYAQFPKPGIDEHEGIDARDPSSAATILESAVEGHVLVKNLRATLPLRQPRVVSVFGWDASSGANTSASDPGLYPWGLANSQRYTGGQVLTSLDYQLSIGAAQPAGQHLPEVAFNGTMITGGGSGAITPASMVSPADALQRKAFADNATLHTDFVSQNPDVVASDVCLTFVNAQSAESADRRVLADEYSDDFITNVASKCSNTVVIIHNAGIRLVDSWIDHPNVTAVIYAHLPGEASGDALVDILYGHKSPSGRLPYTVAKNESDYGTLLEPSLPTSVDPQYSQSNFDEGVFIDYRRFIQQGITPRFAFGYGLTYSNFTYSNLELSHDFAVDRASLPPGAGLRPSEGGLSSLYDVLANISVVVTNTGEFTAAEVAQLYLGIPNSGVSKALRGYDKQLLQPGQAATYTFPLRRRDLSTWDVLQQQWVLQPGTYNAYIGKSVLDTQLSTTFTLL